MRHFNRVFLSITLLLGTVFAGAVLPTQAGAVGFAPTGTALTGQSYSETPKPGGFELSVTWTSGPAETSVGTIYVTREINSYTSGTFETETYYGTCTVIAGACKKIITEYNGIPSNYPAGDFQARTKFRVVFAPAYYFASGQEDWIHLSSLRGTDTYVSIDDSATVYGDQVQIAGFVLGETESVGVTSGTIYFYDEESGKFTDFAAGESVTVSNRSDTSTAIGSCNPHAGPTVNDHGTYAGPYPHHWGGGCSINFPANGTSGKFHVGAHKIVARYIDDTNALTRSFAPSDSDSSRNFSFDNYGELDSATVTVSKKALVFAPGDPSPINYGDPVPSYTYFQSDTMTSTGAVTGYVYSEDDTHVFNTNGNGWGYINLPTCTSSYMQSKESGTAGTYNLTCDTNVVNYDYTFNALDETSTPVLTVDPAVVTVTPDNQTIEYGDPVPESSFYTLKYDGFQYGETQSVLDPASVCGSDYTETTTVGTLTISCDSAGLNGNTNYILDPKTSTLTITKAPLDIYAPRFDYDSSTVTGGVDSTGGAPTTDFSAYTVTYADPALDTNILEADTVFVGFKNGEDVTNLGGNFACSSNYDNFTHVGDTESALINCGGVSSNNYAITLHDGSYLVNQAQLYVNSLSNIAVPKGSLDVIYPYNVEGFLNNETQFNALNYVGPICTSGYSPESLANSIFAIVCSGLIANDYYAVYDTGTAVTVHAPAAFPTTTNLTSSTYVVNQGGTLHLHAVVCSGLNAHPGEGLCPGSSGAFSMPTVLPTSIVGFYFNGSTVGACILPGTVFNDCSFDMILPDNIETGTYVVQAIYGGTNQFGYSTETISVEVTAVPLTAWPVNITYHLNTGAESTTAYTESHTAVATWTPMSPMAMGGAFTTYAATHTFIYWQTMNGLETYTAGSAPMDNSGSAFGNKVLYGNWSAISAPPAFVGPSSMAATVSVSGSTVTYDAAPHGATATTNPAGLAVTVTYNGSATPPTNAGTYTVVATITASGYTGTASSTLVINKATPRITWSSPAAVEEGTALSGAQLNAAGSIPGTLSYSPSAGFVPSVGSNALSVTFTPADSANWNNASASVSLTVNAKAVTGGGGGEPTPEPTPAPTVKNLVLGFSMSSSKISKADLVKIANASLDNPDSVITIVGYAQPSGNKAADLKLSRARANAVKAQILALNPDANITIIAKGSAINKTCKKTLNKCAIVSVA